MKRLEMLTALRASTHIAIMTEDGIQKVFEKADYVGLLDELEKPVERHVHYHVPEGSVLHADGDAVQISPWMPPAPKPPAEPAPVAEPAGTAQDTWPAEDGPLNGQKITTDVRNALYVHDAPDPDRPGAYIRNTYKRAKLIEGAGFVWVFTSYEGINGPTLAVG
jgi:hypothetical protein